MEAAVHEQRLLAIITAQPSLSNILLPVAFHWFASALCLTVRVLHKYIHTYTYHIWNLLTALMETVTIDVI